jgi:phosphoglycerol transferase MdoB-like AlkP superfamily enzyme
VAILQAVRTGLTRTALLALACNLALELVQAVGIDGLPWRFKTPTYVGLFVLDTVVVWAVVAVLHAVTGRIVVTSVVAGTLTVVLAFADQEKRTFRAEPLYPADWRFAADPGFLLRMVGPRNLVLLGVGVAVVALASLAVVRIARRRRATRRLTDHSPLPRRTRLTLRVAGGLVGVLVLLDASHLNHPGNLTRAAYDALGARWQAYSQLRNYAANGVAAGLLYNLDVPPVPVPEGYSRERMDRVSRRYEAAADRINAGRDPDALSRVNVVLVLSESLSDPTALRGVEVAHDPLPFTHRLMRTPGVVAGSVLAQGIGGGTANMEFEALTGMSASGFPPQVPVPYQSVVPRYSSFPSVVGWAASTGHTTVAVHPFSTEMYRRREVYRTFGFDRFVHEDTMTAPTRIGHDAYVSDASAFGEVVRALRSDDAPVLANVVTMQNHLPYDGRYDDPVEVLGPDGRALPEAGQYARGLEHSDAALRSLVRDLRGLGEPTVLVVYGDHLPGFYPDSVFAANGAARMHRTPYLVWSNVRSATPVHGPPVVSPTHLVDLAAERVGAAVTPYYALLTELRSEVPALEGRTLLGPDGTPVPRDRLGARARRLLQDYRLVQYDLSVGRRFSADRMLSAR